MSVAESCSEHLAALLAPLGNECAKQTADLLLKEFGSLAAVFAAGPTAQQRIAGTVGAVRILQRTKAAMVHVLRPQAATQPVLAESQALRDYLFLTHAHAPAECFRVLYLNSKNVLLGESVTEGSVDEAPAYPREIMRRALELGATALILVHNHPSGDPQPSRGDIRTTRNIVEAGRHLEIVVHDHLIVARTGTMSFRELGLL